MLHSNVAVKDLSFITQQIAYQYLLCMVISLRYQLVAQI